MIAAIVFVFVIRLRILQWKSGFQKIKSQYGDTTIKRLHRFARIDYRFRKVDFEKKLDFECLVRCRNNNVIPRFLHICLGNKSLRSSLTYGQCQSNLLLEKIGQKKSHVLTKEFGNLRYIVKQQMKFIDNAHICSKFLKSNDLKLKSNSAVH